MKLLCEPPNSRGKPSMLICALSQRNMWPKRNYLPLAGLLDIWLSNALTRLAKKRIGRVKYSPKQIWILPKRCANMPKPHAIAWFGAILNAFQRFRKRPVGAKDGKNGPSAIMFENNASRKMPLGKLRRSHGVKLVRLIKPGSVPNGKSSERHTSWPAKFGKPSAERARQRFSSASRKTKPGINPTGRSRQAQPSSLKHVRGSPSWSPLTTVRDSAWGCPSSVPVQKSPVMR